jgi:4-azaleucine resistance transporter AzlC
MTETDATLDWNGIPDETAAGGFAEVAAGWRTVLPASAAVVPLGLALGVLVVHSGLAWWIAPLLAGVVFAGSLEFLLIGLIAAVAPLSQVAMTALLVNFRHVFYALSFPLGRVHGTGWKAYSTFTLTDEAYALTTSPEARRWSRTRILSIQAIFHAVWTLAVTAGAAVGGMIPRQLVGLDFAVTALFAVLSIEAYRERRSLPLPVLGLFCSLVTALLVPGDLLMVAMGLYLGALVAGYAVGMRRSRHA